jgi:hypothetical protein
MLGKIRRMNRKLIVGAAALMLAGCGTSASAWKNAKGPTLTWNNNAKYSTIEIERADRVGNECGTWRPLATIPGDTREVKALEREGATACYRLRGCTSSGCSPFTEPSWKGASH